jgi:hypothetical protein
LPEIDPLEELARIVGVAQESDGEDERRFDGLARESSSQSRPGRSGPFL